MGDYKTIKKLAWRNVWRNKRRTILTFLTIVAGCAMIIVMNAFAKGGHDQMIEDAVALNTGHLQIHEKGFWENQTIDYAFQVSDELLSELSGNSGISGYSPRIQAGGLLSFEENTAPALIQGVDPEREKNVTVLHQKVLPGGRYLDSADNNKIIIGETLAVNLGAEIGDTIAMISQGFDGSIAAENLEIVGLARTGNPEYDRMLVVMPLAAADRIFYMMNYVNSMVIKLGGPEDMPAVKDSISSIVEKNKTEVMGWDELMPELVQFIVMDDISAYIFDFVLFMIVAFGILNTIQMSVYERTREFGIMLAIGTRPGQVIKMVLMESFYITLIGIGLGIVLGYLISYYFMINPLDYSSYSEEMAVWGVQIATFPADATLLNLFMTSIVTFILSMLFSIFPARRASRLRPVEAIRHL